MRYLKVNVRVLGSIPTRITKINYFKTLIPLSSLCLKLKKKHTNDFLKGLKFNLKLKYSQH